HGLDGARSPARGAARRDHPRHRHHDRRARVQPARRRPARRARPASPRPGVAMPALTDRVAIVTGAAHGIGRAICAELAREGARVWAADVRAAELDATLRTVEAVAAGSCRTGVVDVRDSKAVAQFVASALDSAGRIDILVNTAGGVAGQTMRPVEEVSDADW